MTTLNAHFVGAAEGGAKTVDIYADNPPAGEKGDPGTEVILGRGMPTTQAPEGTIYIDLDTYDLYRAD